MRIRYGPLLAVTFAIMLGAMREGVTAPTEPEMEIIFSTEGGIAAFPGLSRPVALHSRDFSAEEMSELRRILEGSALFEKAGAQGETRKRGADYQTYTIVVEEAGQRHVIKVSDPVEDENLKALVALLRKKAKEVRTRGGPP
jgi:hypothetical protein